MRTAIWGLLLAWVCVSLTGCSGCGGGLSEAQLRRRSRVRDPAEIDPPPAPAPTQPAVQPQPATPAPAANPPAIAATNPQPTPNPAPMPATPVPATPQPQPAVAAPGPVGPIKVVVQNARPPQPLSGEEKRLRSIANLEKLGQALVAHVERTGALPAVIRDDSGTPLLSWRVALLPDLGYGELYRQFRLNEAWDSPHNSELLTQIPPELQSAERFDRKTNYLGLAGSGEAFSSPRGVVPSAMEDGAENTLAVVEVDEGLEAFWTAPSDFAPPADAPRSNSVGGLRSGLGSLRADGVFAILADGKVVRLGPDLPHHVLLALQSPDGGEQVVAAELLRAPTPEPVEVAAASPADLPVPITPSPAVPIPAEGTPGAPAPSVAPSIEGSPPPKALVLPGDPVTPVDPKLTIVPTEEALAEVRDLFRELYGKQYQEARTWEDKSKFAKLLLAEAAKVETNAAQHYELLRIARDVAAAGGDAASALEAVDLLTKRFQVDGPATRLKLLEDLSKSPRKTESAAVLRKEAMQLLLDAFDADQFEIALPAFERLVEFTRLQGDRQELSRLQQRKQPLEAAKLAYQAALTAADRLKAEPSDGAASETLGKYLCFVKNRWDAGLPHLVRAAEVKLRVVATIDLEKGRSPQDTLSLADQYWDMAGDYKQPFTRGLHLRAALCYRSAQNTLPEGLEKLKAQKRIDEVTNIYGKEVVERALAPAAPRTAVTMD